jgi:hypothetical protein
MSRTQIVALISAITLLIIVLELVRQRRLREEYSWLWLIVSVCYLLVALWAYPAKWLANVIGTTNIPLALNYLGLQFLMLILIQYSVRLSKLTNHVKALAQQIAILDSEQNKLMGEVMNNNGEDMHQDTHQVLEQSEILRQRIDLLQTELNKLAAASG